MKWQGDGLHKQHPPWIEDNPTVYSVVGQVFLGKKTPKKITVAFGVSWSFQVLCEHFHIATSGWQ